MANFNAQAFMDSLSVDMQEKVKACKTSEELQALADANNIDLNAFTEGEQDAELSLEDLEGVGGGKGIAPLALAAAMAFSALTAGAMTGCGRVVTSSSTPSAYTQTTEESTTEAASIEESSQTTTATQSATEANEEKEQTASSEENDSAAADITNDSVSIDQETAINNVKEQAGANVQIISSKKGSSPEGLNCWVVVVSPENSTEYVTYYSGYQFCYSVSNVGIDEETAINNVKERIGYNAEIISCTQGYSPAEGFSCWIVVAKPANSSETVTYYSGYQFCYTNNTVSPIPAANTGEDSNGFFTEAEAIRNVREQAGSGAKIVSSKKGTDPHGSTCWVIVVEPVTNGTTASTVTYYSGYQFCYKAEETQQSDGQNPMMNFIGNYTNGMGKMSVSCLGMDYAAITIRWSGSVSETAVWTMSGKVTVTDEAVTVTYSNCTKEVLKYAEDGTVIGHKFEYEDGSGSVEFKSSDNNAYWNDAKENISDGVPFSYYNK